MKTEIIICYSKHKYLKVSPEDKNKLYRDGFVYFGGLSGIAYYLAKDERKIINNYNAQAK